MLVVASKSLPELQAQIRRFFPAHTDRETGYLDRCYADLYLVKRRISGARAIEVGWGRVEEAGPSSNLRRSGHNPRTCSKTGETTWVN